jgi:hypothetical protein
MSRWLASALPSQNPGLSSRSCIST